MAAVAGQVPETLHNIRTIRALGLEMYMERRYDRRIGDSYAAVERTSFYDAVYSPVVLLDEITADLDAETESRVLEALRHASPRAHRPLHLPPRVRKSRRQDGGAPTAVRQKRHPASGAGCLFMHCLSGCPLRASPGRRQGAR